MRIKDKKLWLFVLFTLVLAWCGRDGVRSALASGIQALATVGAGGTGLTSVTSGGLLIGQGTSPLSVLASPADNTQALCGANPPVWGTTCKGAGGGGAGGGPGILTYSGPSLSLASTQYFPPGGGASASATETNVDVESPSAVTISNFYVQQSAAPGVGNSTVFTWRKNASGTTLTCTISGNAATTCNDITHSFTVAAGDLIDVQAVTTGTPSALTVVMATQYGVVGSSISSGTVAGVPATCTTGAGYFATDGPYKALCTSTNVWTWFLESYGVTYTPLVTANFTAFNIGSVSTTNTGGVINLIDTANEAGLHGYCAAEPSTPTVITIPLNYFSLPGTADNPYVFIAFSNGTAYEDIPINVAAGTTTSTAMAVEQWTNATTFSANITASHVFLGQSSIRALRLSDDGTTKKWFYSLDGVIFQQLGSEARATFLTPTQYCFGLRTASIASSTISGTFMGVGLH